MKNFYMKNFKWLMAAAVVSVLLAMYGNYSSGGIGAVMDSMLYAVPTILVVVILLPSLLRLRRASKKEE